MGIQELMNLSVSEKILLVEKLWDSIAEDASKHPLPEWKRLLIEQRLSDHKQHPDAGISWSDLKNKYYGR